MRSLNESLEPTQAQWPATCRRPVLAHTAHQKTGRGEGLPFSPAHIVPEHIVWGGLGGQSQRVPWQGPLAAAPCSATSPKKGSSPGQRLYGGMSSTGSLPQVTGQCTGSVTGQCTGSGSRATGQNEGMY